MGRKKEGYFVGQMPTGETGLVRPGWDIGGSPVWWAEGCITIFGFPVRRQVVSIGLLCGLSVSGPPVSSNPGIQHLLPGQRTWLGEKKAFNDMWCNKLNKEA